jgi:hypothetical protein
MLSIALITSGGILSTPPDFPFYSFLIALSISSLEIFSILMSSGCPSISGVIMGGGLFRTSWKCSFHLFSCSSFFEITLPLLSFTGELVIGGLPLSCLVMS